MVRIVHLILLTICFITGCSVIPSHQQRNQKADNLVKDGKLQKEIYRANNFSILGYQRITQTDAITTIYFEGDGLAFLTRGRVSSDPTPINPVALKLAVLDQSQNVIYLARHCQYIASDKCQIGYWTSARFSQEVIDTYNQLLNQLKEKYQLPGFNFVGFSGVQLLQF